jgi:hypothetical protein
MALLLATDDREKLRNYQAHLVKHPLVAWRFNGNYTRDYLEQLPCPLNLYYFFRNTIRYRTLCIGIYRTADRKWADDDIPIQHRSGPASFDLYAEIKCIEIVEATLIGKFPKWDNPHAFFSRGQQGLLKVQDILPPRI